MVGPAFAVGLLFTLPGLAWSWAIPSSPRRGDACRRVFVLALPLTLLPAIVLAECGWFNAPALLATAFVLGATGWMAGRNTILSAWHTPVVASLAMAAILILPLRGEWLLGGWDPGVNTNQGFLISRTGTVRPPPTPAQADLPASARPTFARKESGRWEAFPGIPLDPATGAYAPYFYRGTTTAIAWLHRWASASAAFRINYIFGALALLFLYGWLRSTASPGAACAGTWFALTQSVFLHHLHIPASEMMELCLLAALGWLTSTRASRATQTLIALLTLLAAMNRLSFLFLAAIALGFHLVYTYTSPPPRDRYPTAPALAIGLVGGGLWYAFVNPGAMVKIAHLLPGLGLLTLLMVVVLAFSRWTPRSARRWALPALLAGLILRESLHPEPWHEFLLNLPAWGSYTGWPAILVAAAGLLVALRRGSPAERAWMATLVTALFATLIYKHAADLFPWATKRWLASTTLLASLGGAWAFATVVRMRRPYGWIAAALLVTVPLWGQWDRLREALGNTEYDGANDALAEVASHIGRDDVVLADHFLWGTPLALISGCQVLNGEPVWERRHPRYEASAAQTLQKMKDKGHRILLFTSTSQALDIYQGPLTRARLRHEWPRLELPEVRHSKKNTGFPIRTHGFTLRLYEWTP